MVFIMLCICATERNLKNRLCKVMKILKNARGLKKSRQLLKIGLNAIFLIRKSFRFTTLNIRGGSRRTPENFLKSSETLIYILFPKKTLNTLRFLDTRTI